MGALSGWGHKGLLCSVAFLVVGFSVDEAAFATGGQATPSSLTSTNKPPPPGTPHPAPYAADPLSVTESALDTALTQNDGAIYAGMEVKSNDLIVHVLGVGLSQAQSTVTNTLAMTPDSLPASSISFVSANESLASLTNRQSTLTANSDTLSKEGVELVQWGPDVTNNVLSVGVTTVNEQITSDIESLVGSQDLDVHQQGQIAHATANRTTDSPAWWGGDLINYVPSGTCTSGFSLMDTSGVTYDSTAGHCGNLSQTTYQNNQGYGVVTKRYYVNNGNGDDEMISTYPNTAEGWVYVGPTGSGTGKYVHSQAGTQLVGDQVCFDGYYTGESCIAAISAINQCVTVGGVKTCDIEEASGYSPIAQEGDSGGPVYNYNFVRNA